jgi:AP-1-like factor
MRRNQLQSNQDFLDGVFDLDDLCSELRSVARCSESEVVVQQDALQKVLKRLGVSRKQANSDPQSAAPNG